MNQRSLSFGRRFFLAPLPIKTRSGIFNTNWRSNPNVFLVAEKDHLLVGTAMAGFDGYRGWVYHLAVDSTYRRNGIGTALVKKAEGLLVQKGCPKLNLQIRADYSDLQAFYEKSGYTVEERISMGKKL